MLLSIEQGNELRQAFYKITEQIAISTDFQDKVLFDAFECYHEKIFAHMKSEIEIAFSEGEDFYKSIVKFISRYIYERFRKAFRQRDVIESHKCAGADGIVWNAIACSNLLWTLWDKEITPLIKSYEMQRKEAAK